MPRNTSYMLSDAKCKAMVLFFFADQAVKLLSIRFPCGGVGLFTFLDQEERVHHLNIVIDKKP
jgi:hypothetical protein